MGAAALSVMEGGGWEAAVLYVIVQACIFLFDSVN
jgi:hypothetical protein